MKHLDSSDTYVDKLRFVHDRLAPLLEEIDPDIISVDYEALFQEDRPEEAYSERVNVYYRCSTRTINVTMDSKLAIVRDVLKQL